MSAKSVVILANGLFPTHLLAINTLNSADVIICCDGAADQLVRYSTRKPDIIIGDLDSVSDVIKQQYFEVLIAESEQLTNDLTKAFNYALSQNFKKIIFLGTSGGREDHAVANFSLFFNFAKQADFEVYTDHGIFTTIKNSITMKSFIGQQISIFCEHAGVKVNCHNLKWPLINASFESSWQGALNESIAKHIELNVSGGSCLIFQTYT